jgi:hypothetical protein
MKFENLSVISGSGQIAFLKKLDEFCYESWPHFILAEENDMLNIYKLYPHFQFVLVEKDSNELIAGINTVPLVWNKLIKDLPNDGVTWALNQCLLENEPLKPENHNFLCATAIIINKKYRSLGLSKFIIEKIKILALQNNIFSLIAPVRPTLKNLYPLQKIDEYIEWKNKSGLVFDPWLRTHVSSGASIVKICHHSHVVKASIEQWEKWTSMSFPDSGNYIVKDCLTPLIIDRSTNLGIYHEPNVWVHYKL